MGKFLMLFGACLLILFSYVFLGVRDILYNVPPRPKSADENPWWGSEQQLNQKVIIKQFMVNISDSVSCIMFT